VRPQVTLRPKMMHKLLKMSSNICSKGLNVIQEDINDGLHCFTANRFDVVVLAHALQELTHPHIALQRMVDIADEAIVSFPNFGHWSCRLHLGIKGKMPMSRAMPLHWYDTPNIHFCTVRDFEALCSALEIDIIERATVSGNAQHLLAKWRPNLFATSAIYRIRRSGG
jgi:methionine biosynthesis protein MetW